MGISGNLKTMVLAELLQWLSQGHKTGTLVIDSGKVEKRIFFDQGTIISSASTDPAEYLGRFLATHGNIPEEEINQAVARQKQEKKLIGKILVDMGTLTEDQLQQALQQKAEETIYDVFTWEQGEFEFLDDQLPEETMIKMNLDVQWIVLEGSRRKDEWDRIREWVPSPQAVPVMVAGLDGIEVEEVERLILGWIDDDRTVEEISEGSQTSLFLISQIIAAQVRKGHVKVVRPRFIEVEVPAPSAEGGEAPPQMINPYQMMPGQQPMPMPGYGAHPYVPVGVDVGGGRTLHFAGGGAGPQPGFPPGPQPMPPPAAPPAQEQAPSAPPSSAAEGLLQEAEAALQRGDLAAALRDFRKATEAEGSGPSVEETAKKGEDKVVEAMARDGVKLSAVPKLKCGMEELTELDISPQEGFMLTRIDGSYDIQSVLKINPMPKVDALMLFWRLKKEGHVAV